MSIRRGTFLRGSMADTAGAAMPAVCASAVLGANNEIRVGVVGCGGRGAGAHVPRMAKQAGVRVVAVCDPDRVRMGRCADSIAKRFKHKVDQYVDVRKLLERKDINVISNATQNYWHGLSTIWACQAGKDVYVEKPMSHYIREGRQMVNAARKYSRIVQCDTQRRSQRSVIEAIKWVQAGNLGKIRYITAFANKPRASIGKRDTPLPIPETVDYETPHPRLVLSPAEGAAGAPSRGITFPPVSQPITRKHTAVRPGRPTVPSFTRGVKS